MIEPEQLLLRFGGAGFGRAVVTGPNEKPPAWSFFRHVRQGESLDNCAVASDERTATLVRIRLTPVRMDGFDQRGRKRQGHCLLLPKWLGQVSFATVRKN